MCRTDNPDIFFFPYPGSAGNGFCSAVFPGSGSPSPMCTVEVVVLGDTFRLKPETELHTHCIDSVCDRFQTAFQLVGADIPVTQSADISSRFPNQPSSRTSISTLSSMRLYDIQDLFFIKIKVGCFPVVDQHRTSLMFVFATAQMFPEGMMEVGTHLFQILRCCRS